MFNLEIQDSTIYCLVRVLSILSYEAAGVGLVALLFLVFSEQHVYRSIICSGIEMDM